MHFEVQKVRFSAEMLVKWLVKTRDFSSHFNHQIVFKNPAEYPISTSYGSSTRTLPIVSLSTIRSLFSCLVPNTSYRTISLLNHRILTVHSKVIISLIITL